MEKSKAGQILDFYGCVHFDGNLPQGINIMNPYAQSQDIRFLCSIFYHKFYNDTSDRVLILGINPGRLGAGATGIPFTDTKRLNDDCGIPYDRFTTHEPSSVFIYEMINAFGGPELFYSLFYINSVCPLGFVKTEGNKVINYNYYDDIDLQASVANFILDNLRIQIEISGRSDICFCLGTGKNFKYLSALNEKYQFFGSIIPLEHPRFIMQYKAKEKQKYIDDYLLKLKKSLVLSM
jgi:hypothetical protein